MLWESRIQPKESGQGRLPGSYMSLKGCQSPDNRRKGRRCKEEDPLCVKAQECRMS